MKISLLFSCFIFFLSCQIYLKTSHEFNFNNSNPIEFLDFLKKNRNQDWYWVNKEEIPENWLSKKYIHELFKRTQSHSKISLVIDESISFDPWSKKGFVRRTEGYEALLMLHAIKNDMQYPYIIPPLKSTTKKNEHSPDSLNQEIMNWYIQIKDTIN